MKVNSNTTNVAANAGSAIDRAKDLDRKPGGAEPIGSTATSGIQSANVEISDDARLMQQAKDIAKQVGATRPEQLAALKKSVQKGSYKVHSGAIADRLIDEHLLSDFGKNRL